MMQSILSKMALTTKSVRHLKSLKDPRDLQTPIRFDDQAASAAFQDRIA